MKKLPSKVAHNRPPTFFFNTGPAAHTAQKQKSRTSKSPLMQDWVFRLGISPRTEIPRPRPTRQNVGPIRIKTIQKVFVFESIGVWPSNRTLEHIWSHFVTKLAMLFRSKTIRKSKVTSVCYFK
jgi:hypothetical protein